MTKLIFSTLAALALFNFAPAQAFEAELESPLYTCSLTGNVKGRSIAIIIGGQIIKGPGRLTCIESASGRTINYPVNLRLIGMGVGFDLTKIKSMQIVTAGLGVNDPALFGDSFSLGYTAGASLINAGVAFDVAVRANARNGFGFEAGLQGQEVVGLGGHIYGMTLEISGRKTKK